ncbi:hypothetical protein GCM10009751_15410 [Myceligenerans crystallogenes]|uniref:CGNR zinc finger domain-containing protein n=1 Tax=Myceligenerans crystallogenes TaxID=316335 RepID=A0ABN2NDG2_9MICO
MPLWDALGHDDGDRGAARQRPMGAPAVTDASAAVTDAVRVTGSAPVTDAASVTDAARCLGIVRDERGRVRQVWRCLMCDGAFAARAGAKTCSARCRQALRRAQMKTDVTDADP